MRIIFPIVLLLCSFCSSLESYKILFYSNLFGHSHVKFLGAAADILTDAGHNVTVVMPVFEKGAKTCLKSTKNVIYVDPTDEVAQFAKVRTKMMANLWLVDNTNPFSMLKRVQAMSNTFGSQCRKVLSDSELIEKIKAQNFDLAVTEPFDTCAYAFFEAIQIRAHVAILSSSRLDHVSDVIGQPAAPSYNPGLLSSFSDKMSTWQRFVNVLQYVCGSFFFSYIGDNDAAIAKEINSTWRTWRETLPEASFLLTNQIPLLDFPSPTFDKIVPVGGLSVKTDKKSLKLEEKWDKILSLRKKNVFISFGSNARSVDMPEVYKNAFIQVFKSMPDTTFIWKYENSKDTIVDGIDNVYLGEWLPQNELLADERLTVFLTHGGLGSVTELAMMGKPAVMVPLFADQARNAQMLKRHGGAAVLSKTDLSNSDLIRETIEEVLNNPEYKRNAERVAEMLNSQPTKPRETFIKYVEFAARFGKLPSLDNHGRQQGFIQYFFLDIISIALVTVVVFFYVAIKIGKLAVRKCCGARARVEEKKKTE